ncbi:MAG TPA: sugar-transfer associated ATP-grasp domain-containing protein [Azospirillum sp.]
MTPPRPDRRPPFADWNSLHRSVTQRLSEKNGGLQPDLDPAIREALWRRGFLADKWRLLSMESRGFDGFLSDVQRHMARNINGRHGWVLDDKFVLYKTLQTVARQPEMLVALYDGHAILAQSWHALLNGDAPATVYAKPAQGSMGHGLVRATLGGGAVTVDGRRFGGEDFLDRLRHSGSDYVVTLGVVQHPDMAALFPGTTNTLRVLVARHPRDGKPFIGATALRVGTVASGPIDNFSRGGLSFPVDPATGLIGRGVRRLASGHVEPVEAHPDSGLPITGRTVPLWPEVAACTLGAFVHLPFLRYVGWDVAVGPEGPVVIEGNSYSGVDVFQVHGPVLHAPALRAFYEHHGILAYTGPCPIGRADPATHPRDSIDEDNIISRDT